MDDNEMADKIEENMGLAKMTANKDYYQGYEKASLEVLEMLYHRNN